MRTNERVLAPSGCFPKSFDNPSVMAPLKSSIRCTPKCSVRTASASVLRPIETSVTGSMRKVNLGPGSLAISGRCSCTTRLREASRRLCSMTSRFKDSLNGFASPGCSARNSNPGGERDPSSPKTTNYSPFNSGFSNQM